MTEIVMFERKFVFASSFDFVPIFSVQLPKHIRLEYVIDREGNLYIRVMQLIGILSKNWRIELLDNLVSVEFLEKFNRIINGDEKWKEEYC